MNPRSFPPTYAELQTELQELGDWDERYDYLIDLGKQLPPLPTELQTDEYLVKGCMSTVWLIPTRNPDPPHQVNLQADSDSLIVKGLIVLLLAFFGGKTLTEICAADAHQAFAELGLSQHLSPQRRNGLFAMVKRLKEWAQQQAPATI